MTLLESIVETWLRGVRAMADGAPTFVRDLGRGLFAGVVWLVEQLLVLSVATLLLWPLAIPAAHIAGIPVPYWPASGVVAGLWTVGISLPFILGVDEEVEA